MEVLSCHLGPPEADGNGRKLLDKGESYYLPELPDGQLKRLPADCRCLSGVAGLIKCPEPTGNVQ